MDSRVAVYVLCAVAVSVIFAVLERESVRQFVWRLVVVVPLSVLISMLIRKLCE